MARDHGRVMASIWDDETFVALPPGPQRLYLFLLSQADLSYAGVIALRLRRWASRGAGLDADQLADDLRTLAETRFVVIDEDTEEVLVRTLIRNDGIYKQPNVMRAAVKDAREILSPLLRAALADELDVLPLGDLSDKPSAKGSPSPREAVTESVRTLLETLPRTLPGTPRETLPERDNARVPQPQPPPQGSASGGSAPEGLDSAPTAQTLVGEWIDACPQRPPKRIVGQVAREVRTLLEEGIPYADVRNGLRSWHHKRLHPSTIPSEVHALRLGPTPAAAKPSTTDQRVQAGLDLAAQYRAAEEAEQRRAIGATP